MDYNGNGFFGFIKNLQGDIVSIVPLDPESNVELNMEYDAWGKPIIQQASSPEGKIVKSDVSVAKNYLSEQEMRSLERIVSAYLDLAEDRAERHIPMKMEDWAKRLDQFLMADDREVLQDAGKITAEIAKVKAETEFEKYRVIQDRLFMSDFDKYMLELEDNAKK